MYFSSKPSIMDLETTREKSGMFYDVKSKNDVSEIG